MKIDHESLRIASEYIERFGYKPENGPPTGYDANEWALYLLHCGVPDNKVESLSCRICDAVEDAELFAVERVLSRMGWKEIDAYNREWKKTQGDDDAGGYWIRCISRLFGVKRNLSCGADIGRYKRGCRAMVERAACTKEGV